MSIVAATWLVRLLGLYLLLGILFAVPFVIRGVGKIDPNAREGSRGFRILITPGVIALWPLLLRRIIRGLHEPPAEKNAHRVAAASSAGEAP
jgi:Na+-driven multidrug efflux pump